MINKPRAPTRETPVAAPDACPRAKTTIYVALTRMQPGNRTRWYYRHRMLSAELGRPISSYWNDLLHRFQDWLDGLSDSWRFERPAWNSDEKITCGHFLRLIYWHQHLAGNNWVDKTLRCNARIYCSNNCRGFDGFTYTMRPTQPCYICLKKRRMTFHYWYGLLVHESRHCVQFYADGKARCGSCRVNNAGYTDPPKHRLPPATGGGPSNAAACALCLAKESDACSSQAAYLYPNDALLQQEWTNWCKCNSCGGVCAGLPECNRWRKQKPKLPDIKKLPFPWSSPGGVAR